MSIPSLIRTLESNRTAAHRRPFQKILLKAKTAVHAPNLQKRFVSTSPSPDLAKLALVDDHLYNTLHQHGAWDRDLYISDFSIYRPALEKNLRLTPCYLAGFCILQALANIYLHDVHCSECSALSLRYQVHKLPLLYVPVLTDRQ